MQEGDFPSLAKRPMEDQPLTSAQPPAPENATKLPDDVQSLVAAALSKSAAADERFQRNLPVARSRVTAARGAAPSSESWVAAQTGLSALEIDRADSVGALADLDALYIRALQADSDGTGPRTAPLIQGSRQILEQQVQNQQDIINQLRAALR